MKQEDLIDKYVEAHANCRWMDAEELRDLLNSFVGELLKDAVEASVNTYEYIHDGSAYVEFVADMPVARFRTNDKVRIVVLKEEEE